jgi:(1->4)-alpha-D-glucan 1-alpha-D-glucosylmutase
MAVRVPTSTYRLQLHAGFKLEDALDAVDYLQALGIGDLYLSPVFAARQGSPHGYDVSDPTRVNPELGTGGDFNALCDSVHTRGMGLLLDIVPNHMSSFPTNPWWRDVLENGPASAFESYFDVQWHPGHTTLRGRVLLPVLAKSYAQTLEAGELILRLELNGIAVHYFDRVMPLDPATYPIVLRDALGLLERTVGLDAEERWELAAVLDVLRDLPDRNTLDVRDRDRRARGVTDTRERLGRALERMPRLREAIEQAIAGFNGTPGDPASFERLHLLLEKQAYQLAFWRSAYEELNYRRFFDIADLIGVRIEDPTVFEATHALILRWLKDGKVSGLRVDHVDGLRDPTGYAQLLRKRAADTYIVVEKILCGDETLPGDWPVQGTTGYEFGAMLNALFVDPVGIPKLGALFSELTGDRAPLRDMVYAKKWFVLSRLFGGEVAALQRDLSEIARRDRHACDIPASRLGAAIKDVSACLPIYRTYTRDATVASRDAGYIEAAVRDAAGRGDEPDTAVLSFLRRVLLIERPGTEVETWLDFVQRWQQLTGPAMAKGFEDTTLYIYNRLLSANEVGSEPDKPALAPADFHRRIAKRRERWPATLNATTTHDSKRAEDVRARLNVLSELRDEWTAHVLRWHDANAHLRETVRGLSVPDANEELLIYQTLVGAWPLVDEEMSGFHDRIRHYVQKAVREARTHSSWLRPNEAYENAILEFVTRLLDKKSGAKSFLEDFLTLQRRIAFHGALNALSQLLVKATAPGVPDFYQGTELWTLSLVDPDNRRPVNLDKRRAMLKELHTYAQQTEKPRLAHELLESWRDGRIKMFVTWRALQTRKERAELFEKGSYVPLEVTGAYAENVVAFARENENQWAITIVPRLTAKLTPEGEWPIGEVWGDTRVLLPDGCGMLSDVFTGKSFSEDPDVAPGILVRELFSDLPFALLA